MIRFAKVEGYPNLVRDKKTNAILNTDKKAIEEARERKKIHMLRKQEENEYRDKINKLESDISDIKEALKTLLNRSI